ncbi:hypothetical protein HGRIS_009759 [Hohenbuehelia grisea]|uniref:Xylanolytic transcriptional activator regulatory domain-containing protein n=1 Tax=Hohenbuehelia grisea TaxID=104357 RepID=A0ABR3J3K7_9AGAR
MPVDSSISRRATRKLSTEEEVDVRRARGEISCAECRRCDSSPRYLLNLMFLYFTRLKLKCDKKLPCSSCVRRGCPSICPNGSLSTGQGTRFVLADTAQLHAKITEMGQRIRQLEDALAIFQAGVSNEHHPLLREELLRIKFYPDKEQETSSAQDSYTDSIDALGTLTIGDRGEAKYFGRSAGSETLFLAGAEMEMVGQDEVELPPSSEDIARLSNMFPFGAEGSWNVEEALDMLFSHLPSQPRAWALCETYLEQATLTCRPLQRSEIVDDILSPIYKHIKDRGSCTPVPSVPSSISPHKLAVLFMIFALGALVDLTLTDFDVESENFYHLSRASLSLRSIFDSPEISTVQAILLMASYHNMGGRRFSMDSSWGLQSLSSKLAQSMGLHRDSARWKMDSKTIQRRRLLFWETFSMDLFCSLALGRPPAIRLSYVDCEFPEDWEASLDPDGQQRMGYYRWKYEFTKEIFTMISEITLAAEPPSYQTILDLDRKVREKTVPSHLNTFISGSDDELTPSAFMRGCLLSQFRAITLLYIHRSFFAQAVLDHPINPLRSPYAPSFLAAYRCASGVIKICTTYFERLPGLCMRWWLVWTHLFSAAIIVGSIVTRAPSSTMAPNAFIELGIACDLFEKGAAHSLRARSGFAILQKLREKAFQVYSQFRSGNPMPLPDLATPRQVDYAEDELAIFGGQTRILLSKILSRRGKQKHRESSSSNSSPSPSASSITAGVTPTPDTHASPTMGDSVPDVHPSLVEYLTYLPASPFAPGAPDASLPDIIHATPSTRPIESNTMALDSPFTQNPYPTASQDVLWQPPTQTPGPGFFAPTALNAGGQTSVPYPVNGQTMFPAFDNQSGSNLADLGMMMSGESGIDEQWLSFMRDSGFLDGSLN